MAGIDVMAPRRFGETTRKDNWWLVPGLTGAVLLAWVLWHADEALASASTRSAPVAGAEPSSAGDVG
jgi:hypothetical protein